MRAASPPIQEQVRVLANERVCEGVGSLVLDAPRCASTVLPGQFVHLRIGRDTANILRRPFSVYRAGSGRIEILYQIVGKGTLRLAQKVAGDESMDVVGPLGQGWRVPEGASHALLVTGGLGAAPLGMLADDLASRGIAAVVAMGAPCGERLVARDHYERVARRVEVATDDGSCGQGGFVTRISARLLASERFDVVYTCGPEPMQRIVAVQAAEAGVRCQVSLERLMACGIGACLSCVVATRDGQKRACVDGPVFDAEEVLFDASEIPPKH